MVLDLSYRYADLGTAQSGRGHDLSTAPSSTAASSLKDITSNDVMLGVRYKLQREAVVYQPVK